MKKVQFKEANKSSEHEEKLKIICDCFRSKCGEILGTLNTRPKLQEKDFMLEIWKQRQKEGHLKNKVFQQIQTICQAINSRIQLNIDPNHPLHLMLFEYLYWLALTLSCESRSAEAISQLNNRIDYINALLQSELLSINNKQDQEMATLLKTLKMGLRKMIPALKPETPTTQLQSHFETLIISGKSIIDNGIRFLYVLFSNVELLHFPGIANLQANDPFIAAISYTKSGQLLKALLIAPQVTELFKEKIPTSPTQSPRNPRLTAGLHKKNSMKQIQITNPFITSDKQLCIPNAILNKTQKPPTSLIEFFVCEAIDAPSSVGIHSPFLNKPNLINTFMKMHALLYETSRALLSCKEGMELTEEDHDILNLQVCNSRIVGLMKNLNVLKQAMHDSKQTLIDFTTQTWEILRKETATTDPNNAIWLRNIASISNIAAEFDLGWKTCYEKAIVITEIATSIPVSERKKTTNQKVTQYEQSLELLNQEIENVLTNLPKSPDTSPKSSPRDLSLRSQSNSRASSPTLTNKGDPPPAEEKKIMGRHQEIKDSLARRRREGKPVIAVANFVIPEPKIIGEARDPEITAEKPPSYSTPHAPQQSKRPPPPKQAPSSSRASESSSPPMTLALGSPVILRKKEKDTSTNTSESRSLFLDTHSPRLERKTEQLEAPTSQDAESSSDSEKQKQAHRLSLFGINKNTPEKRYLIDQDIPDVIAQIQPDTECIYLQKNGITGIGAVTLCKALETHTAITQLNLSCNPNLFSEIPANTPPYYCPHPAALALKTLLETNTSIKEIWLSACGFTSISASFFANGLRGNASLEFFDIGSNCLTDDGAIMLFEALNEHPTLFSLALDENNLTDTAGKALLALVQSNTHITFVRFDKNLISETLADEIQAQVNANWHSQESFLTKTANM